MDAENHPDPFQDAMQAGLRHAVELIYAAGTAGQVYLHHKRTQAQAAAERDERARRVLGAQIRAERDAARAGWAPALDPNWLRHADLPHAARAWGAAVPYADRAVPWYEPAAAAAMRRSEERLRLLHPYAMARYDRLRSEGLGPGEAMRRAAPLFTRPARARDGSFTPHPALDAGNGAEPSPVAAPNLGEPAEAATAHAMQQRGRQIVDALQARAQAQGRDPLGEAEQRTVLETVTNLPPEVIDRVVQPGGATGLARTEQGRAAAAERVRAAGPGTAADLKSTPGVDERTEDLAGARGAAATADAATARAVRASQPWRRDFPAPIKDVMAAAASQPTAAAPPSRAHAPARAPARGRRL